MFGFINENESVLVVHSDVWWKYCFILSNTRQKKDAMEGHRNSD